MFMLFVCGLHFFSSIWLAIKSMQNVKQKTKQKNAMTIQIKKTSTWLVGLELNAVFYTKQNDKKIMHKSNAFERTF